MTELILSKRSLLLSKRALNTPTPNGFSISKRAESSYVEKRQEESGNVTYLYSKEHIEKRNKGKMKRLKRLNGKLSKLRSQIRKDLGSDNYYTKYTALAVALIDETYERVGNEQSAKDLKHFGVTTWRKKHITFSEGVAKIKYVGKSGVKQEKEVTEKRVLEVLKELLKDKKDNDKIFNGEEYNVSASTVNAYLKPFNVSAKDIRGLHANEEMRKALKEVRKGKLPSDVKEKEKQLKEEFKEALEIASANVGHEAATLKNQYLIPTIEPDYLKDGSIGTLASLEYDIVKLAEERTYDEAKSIVDKTPVGFFHYNLGDKYPDLSETAARKVALVSPTSFFDFNLQKSYPKIGEYAASNLLKESFGIRDFFNLKLHHIYFEMGLEAAKELIKIRPTDFYKYKLGKTYPELYSMAIEELKKAPGEFFMYGLEEKHPELGTYLAKSYAEQFPESFIKRKLYEKYPEIGESLAQNLLKSTNSMERDSFFLQGLHKVYPDIGKPEAVNIAKTAPGMFFRYFLHKTYPEIGAVAAEALAEKHPKGFFFYNLHETYPEIAKSIIQKLPMGFSSNQNPETDNFYHLKSSGFSDSQRPHEYADLARYEFSVNDPFASRDNKLEKDVLSSIFHQEYGADGHTTVGIPGYTKSWALVSFPNREELVIEQLQSDLPSILYTMNKSKKKKNEIKEKYGISAYKQFMQKYSKHAILYPYIVFEKIASFAKLNNITTIKLSSAKNVSDVANIGNEKKVQKIYEELPKKLGFKSQYVPALLERWGGAGRWYVYSGNMDELEEKARSLKEQEMANIGKPQRQNISKRDAPQKVLDIEKVKQMMISFIGDRADEIEVSENISEVMKSVNIAWKSKKITRKERDILSGQIPKLTTASIEDMLVKIAELHINSARKIKSPALVSNSSITSKYAGNEVNPAKRTADSLYKIIEFAFYRVPMSERKRFVSRLRGKVLRLDPTDIGSKDMPASSAIGQSISFAKNLLSGLNPAFIQKVLAELTNIISREMGKTVTPPKGMGRVSGLIISKRAMSGWNGWVNAETGEVVEVPKDSNHYDTLNKNIEKFLSPEELKLYHEKYYSFIARYPAPSEGKELDDSIKERWIRISTVDGRNGGAIGIDLPNTKPYSVHAAQKALINAGVTSGHIRVVTKDGEMADLKYKEFLVADNWSDVKSPKPMEAPTPFGGPSPFGVGTFGSFNLSKRALDPIAPTPNVVIEPMEPTVQKAVNKIKSMDPSMFHNVTKIVVHPGGGQGQLGHVEMGGGKDPREVHIFKDRVDQIVQQQMQGRSDPQAAQEATERALMEVITHEVGHIGKTRTQEQIIEQPFHGESEAERHAKEFMGRLSSRDFALQIPLNSKIAANQEALQSGQVSDMFKKLLNIKNIDNTDLLISLIKWQKDNDLDPTGKIDVDTVLALKKKMTESSPQVAITPTPSDKPFETTLEGFEPWHSEIGGNPMGIMSIPMGVGGGGR